MAVKAVSQLYPIPCTRTNAKKEFNAILGAWAKGNLAINASSSVATADDKAVAVNSYVLSIPVAPRIAGFTARI